jgi:hypothetical protein
MATETTRYHSAVAMRKARDKLSGRFTGMAFAEQEHEMERPTTHPTEEENEPQRQSA